MNQKRWTIVLTILFLFMIQANLEAKTADDYLKIVDDYKMEIKYDEAIQTLEEAIEAGIEDYRIYKELADLYLDTNRFQEAVKYYKASIEDNPESYHCVLNLGISYIMVKEMGKAEVQFIRATKINPNDPHGYYYLGLLKKGNDDEEAIAYLEAAIASDPEYSYSYDLLGDIYYKQNKLDLALLNYYSSIIHKPDNRGALLGLARIYMDKNRKKEALIFAKKTLEIDSDYMPARKLLEQLRDELKNIEENEYTMFIDDFRNGISGWSRDLGDISQYGYSNGSYQIKITKENMFSWAFAPGLELSNTYIVQATASFDRETDRDGEYGFIFNYLNKEDYYIFVVNPDKGYQVIRRKRGEWLTLINWTPSRHINDSINHIKLNQRENKVKFYINGKPVDEATVTYHDEKIKVGLVAGTGDIAPLTANFNGFILIE